MSEIEKTDNKVKMVEDGPVNIRFTQHIIGMSRLGKPIHVTPKAHVCINKPGYKVEYFTETISVCIGIGNDHTAELIMTKDAWDVLKGGDSIHIMTTKEFKKKYG